MLPLSTDCLALRATIVLFEPLGLALLGGCLPLPLSSWVDYTRLLGVSRCSWYQFVGYPGDLVHFFFIKLKIRTLQRLVYIE